MKRYATLLLCLVGVCAEAQVRINALPASSAVASTDLTLDDQSGTTRTATFAQVLTFIQANISVQCATLPALTGVITSSGCTTSWAAATGTGSVVLATSPTLVAPALGTPASGIATNLTGTASGLTAGSVTTNANLTGPITSTGNATAVAAQTGTGSTFVMQASPALTAPNLGTPSAIVLTNASGLPASALPALTGDVTSSAGSAATTIAAGAVTLAKQANLAANSVQCNNTGSPTTPIACTVAQTNTLLGLSQTLTGTTGSIGGGVLTAGSCTSGTVAVTGATTAMGVIATPVTYPGDGSTWLAYVSAGGTVTVKVCALVAVTPGASTYNVRVIP